MRARPRPAQSVPLADRVAEFIRGLPDHPLLDRIVRGRAWIPLLGVMLAGIVAMQVEVLKLTANMGHSITLSASLQSRNGVLRTSVSSLSDAQRIERLATRMGMVMPAPTSINFLHGPVDPGQVAASLRAPDAAVFGSVFHASASQATTAAASAPATQAATTTASATTTTPATTTPVTTTSKTTASAGTAASSAATPTAATPTVTPAPATVTPAATSNTGGASAAP